VIARICALGPLFVATKVTAPAGTPLRETANLVFVKVTITLVATDRCVLRANAFPVRPTVRASTATSADPCFAQLPV
jgi:hypothetical protein